MSDLSNSTDNAKTARKYLQSLEQGATGAALAQFFSPDVVQEELPNRLFAQGSRRNLDGILVAAERGKQVLTSQKYEIKNVVAAGDFVAMEVLWVGTLAIPVQTIPAGGQMRAHFAVFLEFREGKIVAQRNYDCFESW